MTVSAVTVSALPVSAIHLPGMTEPTTISGT